MSRRAAAAGLLAVGLYRLTGAVQLKPRAPTDIARPPTDIAGTGEVLDLLIRHPAVKPIAAAGDVLDLPELRPAAMPTLTHDESSEMSLLASAAQGGVQAQALAAGAPSAVMKAFGPNAHPSNTATFFNLIAIAFGIAYHCCGIPDVRKYCPAFAAWETEPAKEAGAAPPAAKDAAAPATPPGVYISQNFAEPPAETSSAAAAAPKEGAKPQARSAGMDNLKLLLTLLVVEQHTIQCFSTGASFWFNFSIQGKQTLPGGTEELPSYSVDNYFASEFEPWFSSMNQSFFMALFFFVSGFFNPSSFDKKGRDAFLKDKLIRLGIPCLFWHFFMGPVWAYLKVTLTTTVGNPVAWYGHTYGGLFYQVGPPWFILWLLNFNVIYAFAEGAVCQVPFPGVGPLLLFAFAAGVFQSAVPPGDFFIECPQGLHSLSLYAAFFVGGILAKRGAWLDALMKLEDGTVTFLRCLGLASAGAMYFAKSSEREALTTGDVTSDAYLSVESFVSFLMGFQCVILSTVLLHYCLTSWTQPSFLSSNALPAAYTVYLIHPFFVMYGVAAYVMVLRAMNVGIGTFVGMGPPGYVVESTNVIYMWIGFGFVSLFCLSTWPVAYALAKMPGLRNVL